MTFFSHFPFPLPWRTGLTRLAAGCLAYGFILVGNTWSAGDDAVWATRVPEWSKSAVWYQIFPERFRDGDPGNNPGRSSLEWPTRPSAKWRLTPWTGDYYAMDEWEEELASQAKGQPGFYEGVTQRRYGGDLQGVLEKLDYLQELGVNAIYFNPVFYARSHHKYDGNSFHHIDPYFGPDPQGDFAIMDQETADPATWQWTAADKLFLQLLQEAHRRGIRVIIDGVFNHTGRDFFAFADLRKKQADSPYADWYVVESFDDPATSRNEFIYRGWWGHQTLPIFAATEDGQDMAPEPKAYVFAATRRWMDPNGDGDPSDGIDGWRLDVADERPAKFWADWNALVRQINPQAYTVGEVWSNPLELIEHGQFSAAMNYYGFAMPVKGFLIDGNVPATRFAQMLDERREALPGPVAYAMQNLMDSHDTDRLASMVVNRKHHSDPEYLDYNNQNSARVSGDYKIGRPGPEDRAIQRMVALLQMTYVGAPMIYYGTEAGMWGGHDPDVRMPMVWPDLSFAPQARDPRGYERKPDPVAFDRELFTYYQKLIALRRQLPVLNRGGFRILGAFDESRVVVFAREMDSPPPGTPGRVVVAINRSESPQQLGVPVGGGVPGASWKLLAASRDDFPPGALSLATVANQWSFRLPPLTAALWAEEAPQP